MARARARATGSPRIQAELEVTPEFPDRGRGRRPRRPPRPRLPELDRTDLPLRHHRPARRPMDLDQALHIERDGDGYVVHYAIADVAAFVSPGRPGRRGGATGAARRSTARTPRCPLHPKVISEDAASLLPDQVRPALLWTIQVDETGEGTDVGGRARAGPLDRAQLDYEGAQRRDRRRAAPTSPCCCSRRSASCGWPREAARGGVSLPLPEQEVEIEGDRWTSSSASCSPSSSGTRRSRC